MKRFRFRLDRVERWRRERLQEWAREHEAAAAEGTFEQLVEERRTQALEMVRNGAAGRESNAGMRHDRE